MPIPASIRVNANFPFPALVTGSGLIAITKNSGIWTVSFNVASLSQGNSVPDPANTYALVFDPITDVYSLLQIGSFANAVKVVRTLNAGQTPYAALPNDDTLLVNSIPFTVTVDWSQRTKPLRVVDITGNASVATPVTITPAAGQSQLAQINFSYLIDGAGGSITLTPLPTANGAY